MKKRESNRLKSIVGNAFNRKIRQYLENMKEEYIKEYKTEPKYNNKQFRADFEIELKNGVLVVIDNTTTIRNDRVNQKQFIAYGVKKHFEAEEKTVKFFVVVPNKEKIGTKKTREKEIKTIERMKTKIKDKKYESFIDDILYLDELLEMLKK